MSLLFKLQNIGFALSVGTLSVLAVNTPAKADISGDYTTQGNVQTYCETMRDQDKHNHFWALRGFDGVNSYTGIDHNKYTKNNKLSMYMVYKGYVYHVGGLGLTNNQVTQNTVCKNIKKLQPVNVEQQKWADVRCYGEFGCGGGYFYKTMYKLENGNIDLNYYISSKDGSVSRKTIKNYAHMTW